MPHVNLQNLTPSLQYSVMGGGEKDKTNRENEVRKETKPALKPTLPIQAHANIFSFLNLSHLLS